MTEDEIQFYETLALEYGIHARLEDANILYEAGRIEGSLLMTLVAIAGTSRKRYPKEKIKSDKDAFIKFLNDEGEKWRLTKGHSESFSYGGKEVPIEAFLYEYLRCNLIHEGDLPLSLRSVHDDDILTVDTKDNSGFSLNHIFIYRLADVAWKAPENSLSAIKPELDEYFQRKVNHPRLGNTS